MANLRSRNIQGLLDNIKEEKERNRMYNPTLNLDEEYDRGMPLSKPQAFNPAHSRHRGTEYLLDQSEFNKQLTPVYPGLGQTGKTKDEFVGDYLSGGQKGLDLKYIGPGNPMYTPTKETKSSKEYLAKAPKEDVAGMNELDRLAKPPMDVLANELDRNEMDSEALDQWHQDQASDKTAQMDAITQVEGPDQMDQMVSQMNPPSTAPSYFPDDAMIAQSGVEGLLSADDAEKKKKKKGLSKEEKAGYAKVGEMLMGSGSAPDMRPPAPPALSIKQGQIAFPGLLAQQAPTQQRYTPRGLV